MLRLLIPYQSRPPTRPQLTVIRKRQFILLINFGYLDVSALLQIDRLQLIINKRIRIKYLLIYFKQPPRPLRGVFSWRFVFQFIIFTY